MIASSPSLATGVTRACDVISTKRRSSPSDARIRAFAPLARISTSACSGDPIAPLSRSSSRRFCTSARMERKAVHRSTSASSSGTGGSCAYVSVKIVPALVARNTFHASSAVNDSNGAISFSTASVMR